MSKFNNLNPYRLSHDERVVELNGPEISELIKWYKELQEIDPLTAEESSSVIDVLDRGPIFEFHEPLLVTVKQINHIKNWIKMIKPAGEIVDKILAALMAAEKGEQRPDLKPPADNLDPKSKPE